MRLALLLAIGLALGGAVVAVAPTASACTSDPDAICLVINAIGECSANIDVKYPTTTVKRCLP